MNVLVVVPVRLESTRFPNKPLYKIKGREMVLRVLDNLPSFKKIVATPNLPIAEVVTQAGYDVFVTQRKADCGTDRLVELAESIEADIYVNVQGDEPLISEDTVRAIVEAKIANPDKVVTGIANLDNNKNCVKVIPDQQAMSREVYQHIGIYAFNGAELRRFGEGEVWEDIEITRFLSMKYPVHFVQVERTQAVDRLEDIKEVERIVCQKK